jgi:hypothetical protein
MPGNQIRQACGGRRRGLDDRESIGGGVLQGAERKAQAHVLMVAGNGEQRWEGDEGGSGSARSQRQWLCQSVKLLMASDLGVERKSPCSGPAADVCTLFVQQTQHRSSASHTCRISTLDPSSFSQDFRAMDAQQDHPQIPDIKFRVLIIGRANSGKTTILQKVCDTAEKPKIFRLGSWRTRDQDHRVRSRS